jgi:glyoxylase-like metal-dependent hydrolase (beta-lactamase superfamily II)
MTRTEVAVIALACAAAAPVHSQPSKTPPLPASPMVPASYRTVKLADGVYAFIAPIETNVVSGNSLLVVGDDGALVVDTQQFAAVARWEVAEIKKLTDQPVRYVVNTHWHNDHWLGNATFREAWPDAMFLATPNTRRLVIEKGIGFVDPAKASEQLAQLAAVLADRKRKIAPLTRRYLEAARDELRDYIPAMKEARPEPPAATFDRALTVYLGAREVDVRFLGRGNTGGDAVVYVPDAKVVATGDLVVHPVPFAFGSFISEWVGTLGTLAELDAKTIVPGHGELQHDMRYVHALAAALASISAQARAAQAAGKPVEQARKAVDVRSFEQETCGDDPWCHVGFPGAFVQPAFERAFREEKEGRLQDENEN